MNFDEESKSEEKDFFRGVGGGGGGGGGGGAWFRPIKNNTYSLFMLMLYIKF